jgi:hypothetical protein
MRVKDADKLRQFLSKVERAREMKMQRFKDEGVKTEEIHKLAQGERVHPKILRERQLTQRFIKQKPYLMRGESKEQLTLNEYKEDDDNVKKD